MGTTTSAIFSGSSQFSQDFKNVITRAVSIASLPISQLNGDVTALQSQSRDLGAIDSKLAALESAVQGIGDAMGGASFQAEVSNPSVLSATVGDGAMEGSYSVQVEDVGAYATSMTSAAWVNQPNPPGEKHTYRLIVGTAGYDVTPDDNSAASVAKAINAAAADKVRATVVNVGSSSAPDYRIFLQGTTLGDTALDLQDGGASLQQQQTQGRQARYIVNGSGLTVTSSSRSVAISDGLTVNLLASDPGSPVNLTVTRSASALSGALSTFAAAYNAVVDALDQQRGASQGSLNGQSVIYQLQQALSGISTYTAPGSSLVGGLADLGLNLGKDGKLIFDSSTLMSADRANSAGLAAFLGSPGVSGFLKWAGDTVNGIEDSGTGLVKIAEAGISSQIDAINRQIAAKQDQVDQLQQRLEQQMAAADAAIAAMEQQYSYLNSMFQAMQTASQQYK
jgi:flagellar hook-associated protein 2